jgi:hypothetical protein
MWTRSIPPIRRIIRRVSDPPHAASRPTPTSSPAESSTRQPWKRRRLASGQSQWRPRAAELHQEMTQGVGADAGLPAVAQHGACERWRRPRTWTSRGKDAGGAGGGRECGVISGAYKVKRRHPRHIRATLYDVTAARQSIGLDARPRGGAFVFTIEGDAVIAEAHS